jgi:hypothetical protein
MSVSYPVDFPEDGSNSFIKKMNMRIVNSTAVQESPYTYNQKVNHFGGARWEAEVTLRPLTHTEAQQFKGFFASLKGRLGTFMLGNPLDVAGSNDVVSATATASTGDETIDISVSGFTYEAGQTFQFGNHLYMAFISRQAGSHTDVAITPPLRQNLAIGTTAVVDEPKGKWRLASNAFEFDIDKAGMYSFTFSCVEAL